MDLLFAFVCDYADVTGGKVNALGIGFDTIHAPKIPSTHRQFFFVAKVQAEASEAGDKNLHISLLDANGKDVVPPVEGKLTIPRPREKTLSTANLTVGFDNVQFPAYDTYSLHLVIEGITMKVVQIMVAPSAQTR